MERELAAAAKPDFPAVVAGCEEADIDQRTILDLLLLAESVAETMEEGRRNAEERYSLVRGAALNCRMCSCCC